MIGETLGPYRIEAELGTGGMGTVYRATVAERVPDLVEGATVALKLVHPHLLEQRGFFKRFLREAEIGKSVGHENVVRTYDADQLVVGGAPRSYLVMEYVEGQTLRELVDEIGVVPEELCRHIGREMARALAAVHAVGVLHRDVKPDNVLITSEEHIKLMDLGVARLADEVIRLSQTGAFVGSVLYAAPEQFKGGGGKTDGRADLYALGLTIYELATGKHPFADEDLRAAIRRQLHDDARPAAELNPQLTPFIEEVLRNLLQKDADDRFSTAEELLGVLTEGEECAWWQERAQALRVETSAPLRRIRIPRETELYGREAELSKLRAIFDIAKSGDGQVLLIEGEDGIGKTRMVDEFVAQLRRDGEDVSFLFGSYPPGGAATAAGAFSTAYREHFGSEGLEETLRGYLVECPLLIPAFAALLRGDATPAGAEPLTQDSLQTVFIQITRALAKERTTIVLIDDLHYAPDGGRALVASMGLAVPGHRVLVIGTYRPGLPEEWTASMDRLQDTTLMSLGRLGPKDLTRLLVDLFRSERLATELGFQVAAKSDGNPFFVFEMIRGLREGKFITKADDGSYSRTQVIGDIKIPSSVMELVQARIVDLEEEERDMLDVASCCGFEFDPLLVAGALGLGQIPAMKRLARIEKKHRLIRSSGRRYVFDHHQVREALYEGLPELLREPYHSSLGEALEARERAADRDPSELDGDLALQLCTHFLRGGQAHNAVRYLDAAMDHLEKSYLHGLASELADLALGAPGLIAGAERVSLLLRRGARATSMGQRAVARDAVTEAIEHADAVGDPALQCRARCSLVTQRGGRAENHRRVAQEAVDFSVACEDVALQARAHQALGVAALVEGRFDEALTLHERQLALAHEAGDRHAQATAAGSLARVSSRLGRYEEARARLEQEIEIARDMGLRSLEHMATGNLGDLLWLIGRYAEAAARMEMQRDIGREIANRHSDGMASSNLGALHSSMGARDRAAGLLDHAHVIFREIADRDWESYVLHEQALAAERSERRDEAVRLYAEALEMRRSAGQRAEVAETLIAAGRNHLRAGDVDQARKAIVEGFAIATETGHAFTRALGNAYSGLLPDADVSRVAFVHAELETGVPPRDAPEIRFVLWKATQDQAHLTAAREGLMYLRDHAPEEFRETILENVPLHRDIVAAWKEHGGG